MELEALQNLNFSPSAGGTSFSLGMAPAQWPSSYKWPSWVGDWIPGIVHWIPFFSWDAQSSCSSQRLCFGLVPLVGALFQVFSPGLSLFHDSDVSSDNTSSEPPSLAGLKGNSVTERISSGASLVAQWLRICLPMQGTRVRALVWEDPTWRGATRPVSHNYCACASGACAPQHERLR